MCRKVFPFQDLGCLVHRGFGGLKGVAGNSAGVAAVVCSKMLISYVQVDSEPSAGYKEETPPAQSSMLYTGKDG